MEDFVLLKVKGGTKPEFLCYKYYVRFNDYYLNFDYYAIKYFFDKTGTNLKSVTLVVKVTPEKP